MVNYQTISALVDQIPADTWDVLREIKERRPAMMLSELIDFKRRANQQPEPPNDKAAQALGKKGERARAEKLTPKERSAIARKAAKARWAP